MSSVEATHETPGSADAWRWWQGRRLEYNLTLAVAGWIAFGLGVGLHYAFGHPLWRDWREGLGSTLLLAVGYLIIMGAANALFLLGPLVEGLARPADVARYRRSAYAMGRWGSLIVPFSFPLIQLAILISA